MTIRLDQAVHERGLAPSRSRARMLIEAGHIAVNDKAITKPAYKVSATDEVAHIGDPMPWVSRAALKLVAGLDAFDIAVAGRTAFDIGASTGGFTQVLLDRGAAHVFAIDVGHGQLAPALARDARVTSLEGVNARDLSARDLRAPDLIVADVSFISLTLALPPALDLARPGADLVALIKPQFELSPGDIGKGGIVRSPSLHRSATDRIAAFLRGRDWRPCAPVPSPITGSDGNREFLIAARKPSR